MGDAQVTWSSNQALLNFDTQAFYETFLDDMRDDQLWGCESTPGKSKCKDPVGSKGSLPVVVPYDGIGPWQGACLVWQVAYIVIARNYYSHYGDTAMLDRHYAGCQDLMAYFKRNEEAGLVEQLRRLVCNHSY